MIDRYLLRYFLAVVDQGSFSRAAVACRVSQPTLSVGIAKLERIVQAPLFLRSSRRVEVTEVGARFIDHARRIETAFTAAEAVGQDTAAQPLIRIGVLSTLPGDWLEAAVGAVRAEAPHERLEIFEAPQKEVAALLARGRIDMAIAIHTPQTPLRRHLFTEPYGLAMARGHRCAEAVSVRAEDLAGETMIVRRHCEALAATSRHFTRGGVRPFMAARTTSDERALSYVRTGLGVTVMPRCFGAYGIAMASLAGFDAQREIGLLVQKDSVHRLEQTATFALFGATYAGRGERATWT